MYGFPLTIYLLVRWFGLDRAFVSANLWSTLLGLGETEDEVRSAMDELRAAGCDMLVIGQYLRPTEKQVAVVEYLSPERFDRYAELARGRGFRSVVSAPLARTSWHAREGRDAASLATGGEE